MGAVVAKQVGRFGWMTGALMIGVASLALGAPWSMAGDGDSLQRARLDLSEAVDRSTTYDAASPTPGDTGDGIGPGSPLVITIPDAGTFGCTANYVWRSGTQLFLGAAGHCFIGDPEDDRASSSELERVEVEVCVAACYFGGLASQVISGEMVTLGDVVYARQATGDEEPGHDFGLVAIPAAHAELVRPSMPVWGGPTGSAELSSGDVICSYGNGLGVGETVATKARAGIGATTDDGAWYGAYPGNLGDSGSAVNLCPDGVGTAGVGVLTHLSAGYDGGPITTAGTTVARAIEMATEAGLSICMVREDGGCTTAAPTQQREHRAKAKRR